MKSINRFQTSRIEDDLKKKMVFLVGPRQVGKTWLAKRISEKYKKSHYLNYDDFDHRDIINQREWLPNTELLVLDELHKMPEWKNYLKGLFDTKSESMKILVTGSARLDAFRATGDSLAGRFFRHRLYPLSLAELEDQSRNTLDKLLTRGGFPEPFSSDSEQDVTRWRSQYVDVLTKDEILDLENIRNLKAVSLLLEFLRRRVGSRISYQSLSEDIGVAPTTVKRYIDLFESLFIIFRIQPFSKNIARSLRKEPKIYFFDNGMVIGDEGAKLENFTALSLLKNAHGRSDYTGENIELYYLRTKDEKEVDFCVSRNGEVERIIEVKSSAKE
ncbi:MAG: ATP-binding protein [Bdellovibrionota bacterium]